MSRFRSLPLLACCLALLLALSIGGRAAAAVPPCHHMAVQAGVAHAAAVDVAPMHAAACHHAGAHAARHDHGRCVACPACCAGVALAPTQPRAPPAAGPAFVAIPFRAGHLPSVDPSLLERPPRHPSA